MKDAARKAFIECEAAEKIRCALRHNVREDNTRDYASGERVYYKIKDSTYWRGPAEIIGKDSHQVILKHRGLFVRAHPVSLRRVDEPSQTGQELSRKDLEKAEAPEVTEVDADFETEVEEIADEPESEGHEPEVEAVTAVEEDVNPELRTDEIYTKVVLKINTRIRFREQETTEPWQEGVVVSRAGKAKGVYSMWMNVKKIPEGEHIAVDFVKFEWNLSLIHI